MELWNRTPHRYMSQSLRKSLSSSTSFIFLFGIKLKDYTWQYCLFLGTISENIFACIFSKYLQSHKSWSEVNCYLDNKGSLKVPKLIYFPKGWALHTHSFTQQKCIEYLPSARNYSRYMEYIMGKVRASVLAELI